MDSGSKNMEVAVMRKDKPMMVRNSYYGIDGFTPLMSCHGFLYTAYNTVSRELIWCGLVGGFVK